MMAEDNLDALPVFIDVGHHLKVSQVTTETVEGIKDEPPDKSPSHQKDRIKCSECLRFTADTEEKMLRHVRKVHRGENPFQCLICEYSTYNKAVLDEHVRRHLGLKPFQCSFCPYKSASKKNAKKHELIHRPNNPLRCPDCPFIGRHYRGLVKHQRSHVTDPALLKCSSCAATFKKPELLAKHKKMCVHCRRKICVNAYEKHMTRHSSKSSVVVKKHLFQCALCPWAGTSKPRILLHLIHHPRQHVEESVVDVSVLKACGIPVGAE